MADNIKMGKVVDGELYAGVLGIVATCNRNSSSGDFENITQITEPAVTYEQVKDACLKGYSCNLVLRILDSTSGEFEGAYFCKAIMSAPTEIYGPVVIFDIPSDDDMIGFKEDNTFEYINQ